VPWIFTPSIEKAQEILINFYDWIESQSYNSQNYKIVKSFIDKFCSSLLIKASNFLNKKDTEISVNEFSIENLNDSDLIECSLLRSFIKNRSLNMTSLIYSFINKKI